MGADVIDVKAKVRALSLRTFLLFMYAWLFLCFAIAESFFIGRFEEGSYGNDPGKLEQRVEITLGPMTGTGCCAVEHIQVSPVWRDGEWNRDPEQLVISIHIFRGVSYGPMGIRLGESIYGILYVFMPPQGSPCGMMNPACVDDLIRDHARLYPDEYRQAVDLMLVNMRIPRRNMSTMTQLQWWRLAPGILRFVCIIGAFVCVIVSLPLTVRRIRWGRVLKGERVCPSCRYELAARDDGVLWCSECGLKCRVGEG